MCRVQCKLDKTIAVIGLYSEEYWSQMLSALAPKQFWQRWLVSVVVAVYVTLANSSDLTLKMFNLRFNSKLWDCWSISWVALNAWIWIQTLSTKALKERMSRWLSSRILQFYFKGECRSWFKLENIDDRRYRAVERWFWHCQCVSESSASARSLWRACWQSNIDAKQSLSEEAILIVLGVCPSL